MSVIQGGPGFPILHPNVYAYLFSCVWSPVSIPVTDLKQIVKKVFPGGMAV